MHLPHEAYIVFHDAIRAELVSKFDDDLVTDLENTKLNVWEAPIPDDERERTYFMKYLGDIAGSPRHFYKKYRDAVNNKGEHIVEKDGDVIKLVEEFLEIKLPKKWVKGKISPALKAAALFQLFLEITDDTILKRYPALIVYDRNFGNFKPSKPVLKEEASGIATQKNNEVPDVHQPNDLSQIALADETVTKVLVEVNEHYVVKDSQVTTNVPEIKIAEGLSSEKNNISIFSHGELLEYLKSTMGYRDPIKVPEPVKVDLSSNVLRWAKAVKKVDSRQPWQKVVKGNIDKRDPVKKDASLQPAHNTEFKLTELKPDKTGRIISTDAKRSFEEFIDRYLNVLRNCDYDAAGKMWGADNPTDVFPRVGKSPFHGMIHGDIESAPNATGNVFIEQKKLTITELNHPARIIGLAEVHLTVKYHPSFAKYFDEDNPFKYETFKKVIVIHASDVSGDWLITKLEQSTFHQN